MEFIEIEKVKTIDNWDMHKSHSHEHYELYYLISGNRNHIIEDAIFNIEENSFILIPPNVVHRTEGSAFERIIVNFNIEYMDILDKEFINDLFDTKAISIDNTHAKIFVDLLNNIYIEYTQTFHRTDDYLKIKIAELIVLIKRYLNNNNSRVQSATTNSTLINKIIKIIENDFINLTLDSLSKRIFVSKEHISREFKKCTNLTICEYINNKKISEAMFQLINTNNSIDEIAFSCGFSSANYFGFVFKQSVGLSPMQYRKIKLNPQLTKHNLLPTYKNKK